MTSRGGFRKPPQIGDGRKKRLLITGDFMRYNILIMLCLIFELTACTAVQTEYRNVDDSRSWNSYYSEEVTVLTEPNGACVFYQGEYVGTSPITFNTRLLKYKVYQSGTYEESYRYNPLFDTKKNYKRASGTYWKEPYVSITGGYKVEVFKEGYLPNDIFVYIKENDQTFKEAFRNVKPSARYGLQTSYIGNRKLLISLTPSPASSQSASIAQQQQ